MKNPSKKTLLYEWHVSQGASMSDFGGYEMPLWYLSAKDEHMAVITRAGMFDTSHMASVMVSGPDSFNLLQRCFSNDMSACIGKEKKALFPGRCVYGAFLNEKGEVLDDAIVFYIEKNTFMVVVNAGMGGKIAEHLQHKQGKQDVLIIDMTDNLGKMDIQGPLAAKVMKKVLADPEKVFKNMPYFSFKGHFDAASPLADDVRLSGGTPIMLSRTGYTGEFGFEIFMLPEHFVRVWKMVLSAGEEFSVPACGLAARDSLRAGAVLPLSHQDIGHWTFISNPWTFALPYRDDGSGFSKEFIGDKALINIENPEHTHAFAGNDLRKVTLPAIVLDTDGKEIGTVLTCVTDMAIGRHDGKIYSIVSKNQPEELKIRGLSCGFVKVNRKLAPGSVVELRDKRRKIRVQIENDIRPDRTARRPLKEML